MRRHGIWDIVETPELIQAKAEIERLNAELEQRVVERTKKLEATTARLRAEIEERKEAEEELRRSEARKTAILDSALDCILTIDHEGRITEFNPAAERTFGYRRDEVMGKHMVDVIIPPSLRELHQRGLGRSLATSDAQVLGRRIEMTAMRAGDSEFPVELNSETRQWNRSQQINVCNS